MIALLLLLSLAHADVEVVGGSLTYHILDEGTSTSYSNRLSKDGRLINNPLLGIAVTTHDGVFFDTYMAFAGQNSVAAPMFGGLYEEGLELHHFQTGVGIGGYSQESRPFTDRNIHSFRITNIQGMDLVPVLGIVLNYKIMLYNNAYLKLNNLISPILTNSTLSVGMEF